MAEYIELEVAKKILADDYAYAAAKLLDTVPIADVQEVRHGKWVSTGNALGYTEYHCSGCNNYLFLDSKDSQLYPYCPYCGAKMDSPPS